MIAATFIKPYSIKPLPFKIGKPNFGEVLVKVHKAGICGSDLAIVSGQHPRARPPMVVGHEFSGEIVELGNNDDNHLQIGSRAHVDPDLTVFPPPVWAAGRLLGPVVDLGRHVKALLIGDS